MKEADVRWPDLPPRLRCREDLTRSSDPVLDLGRPGVKFQIPYHWTTRSGAMSTASIQPRQSLLGSSNSGAAGALLGPCTPICSAYKSETTLARHGLDGIVSIVEEQRHLPHRNLLEVNVPLSDWAL